MQSDQLPVALHRLGDLVPERRVQGVILVPARCGPVGVSGRVLKAVCRAGVVERGKLRNVAEEGVRLVNVEVARVYFVHPEPAVQVGQGRDAGPDPAGCESGAGALFGAVVGVVDHEFVLVGVAVEDIRNDMR